ncbi:MAG: hypothetical protein NTZ32_19450 [Planctomycetales bacterium]|nr:hypothetical protein [Planctomycetales bacterium]
MNRLESFSSFHGADFYGLPRNVRQIMLTNSPWTVPASILVGDDVIIPFRAGEQIPWSIVAECIQ